MVLDDGCTVLYSVNYYDNKRALVNAEDERGKEGKSPKPKVDLREKLALGLLGAVCFLLRTEVEPLFWRLNHIVLFNSFSAGDFLCERPDLTKYIRTLTLNLSHGERHGSHEFHPWYPSRASIMKKIITCLPNLVELNLFCNFGTWGATATGGSLSPNSYFMATGDFRSTPFFREVRSHPNIRKFSLLDPIYTHFSMKDSDSGSFVEVNSTVVEVWMRQRLFSSGRKKWRRKRKQCG